MTDEYAIDVPLARYLAAVELIKAVDTLREINAAGLTPEHADLERASFAWAAFDLFDAAATSRTVHTPPRTHTSPDNPS